MEQSNLLLANPSMIIREARMEVAAKLMAAERETAQTSGLLVSRPRELALKALEGK